MNCKPLQNRRAIRPEASPSGKSESSRAFTLLELLMVITIIALLASMAWPRGSGIAKSNTMIAATRQLMDDVGLARQKAISMRSPVYVVFINGIATNQDFLVTFRALTDVRFRKEVTNLFGGQYTSYALYTTKNVGDQPGNSHPRYLTPWKTLPQGTFIAVNKFATYSPDDNVLDRGFAMYHADQYNSARPKFLFPGTDSPKSFALPYICFNSQGQLVSDTSKSGNYNDAYIPLASGSVFYPRNTDGSFALQQAPSVLETPFNNSVSNYNRIHISWATGRAKLERPEISR